MVAGNADRQGHHLKVPFEKPLTNRVCQSRGSFYAAFSVFADEFV